MSRVLRTKAEAKQSYNQMSRGYSTGHCIMKLAQAVGKGGKVCGIDILEGTLTISQKRIHEAGRSERVDLQPGTRFHSPKIPRYVSTGDTIQFYERLVE